MKDWLLKTRFLFILLFIYFPLVSCLQASKLQKSGSQAKNSDNIHSIKLNSNVPLSGLIQELVKADYVLLGEAHDDPGHHRLQNKILEMLVKAGRKPAVVFEMFNREDAGLVASIARRFPHEPDKIAAAVNWKESGWPDWQMYRPMVKTALDAGLPVVAGNLSRLKLKRLVINHASAVSTVKAQTQLGLLEPLPERHKQKLQGKIDTVHGNKIPDTIVKGMLKAQRMRDATMAEAMIARNLGQGAVLIAGQEHARGDYGVPHYLRFREPEAHIISLAFVESKPKVIANQKSQLKTGEQRSFDYVWVLPQSKGKHIAHPGPVNSK